MRHLVWILLIGAAACSGAPPVAPEAAASPPPTAELPPTPTSAPAATAAPADTPTPPTPIPTVEPTAIPESAGRPVFTFAGSDPSVPVVTRKPTAAIENSYINPGGIAYHEGLFHMLFNSFTSWPGLVEIGYLTSPDGLTWTAVQEDPVFTSDDIPYVRQGGDVSSLVVDENGQWLAFFHTVNSPTLPSVIGRATAPSPAGPWTFDPDPILEPGDRGEWDSHGLAWPSVVRTDEGYFLYYAGRDSRRTTRIGLATSPDGITWRKHDDPATAEAPFTGSDPVLEAAADWEDGSVDRMRVVSTPDGWVMIYQAGLLTERGLATSQDGIAWVTHPENPIITAKDFPLFGTTWDTALAYAGGTFYYFLEIGSLAGTNLYLARYEGDLR